MLNIQINFPGLITDSETIKLLIHHQMNPMANLFYAFSIKYTIILKLIVLILIIFKWKMNPIQDQNKEIKT